MKMWARRQFDRWEEELARKEGTEETEEQTKVEESKAGEENLEKNCDEMNNEPTQKKKVNAKLDTTSKPLMKA